jgi:hypothetical protein
VVDREALVGVAIAGGFGIGWAFWAASGLSGEAAAVVRIAGVVIGVVIVAGALFRHGAARPRSASRSMFRSRGYLVWVAAELLALVVGNAVLGATGHSAYVAAWTALVVGVHFIGLGRLFAPVFSWLGVAFIGAAIAGAAAGTASGSRQAVEASTGLIAAASLFAAGAWGLLESLPFDPPPTA